MHIHQFYKRPVGQFLITPALVAHKVKSADFIGTPMAIYGVSFWELLLKILGEVGAIL